MLITNDFHNTAARVHPGPGGRLSPATVRRVRRELCGLAGCVCGGFLGERGRQPDGAYWERDEDGGAILVVATDD